MQPTIRQVGQLARAAMVEQGVRVERLRWMGPHTNHLFRCTTTAGDRLVVRVCLPGGRSDAELDAELTWLTALARDTDLTVPLPRFSTRVASPTLPAGGRCIAFGWVHGRHCEHRPSRRLVADLGRVLATLHRHAERFHPKAGFARPVMDIRYLTWADGWHAAQLRRRRIDLAHRRLLREVADRVDVVLARLGRDRAAHGLIHADLHLGNVLDHQGLARPLDFDDAS
jgi:Ser/Thr protein kinase RdoA (MazF antagonist)